jgi:hypothetical protein
MKGFSAALHHGAQADQFVLGVEGEGEQLLVLASKRSAMPPAPARSSAASRRWSASCPGRL